MMKSETSKAQLMKKINEVSFAVNDMQLYLDTHPEDEKAMEYFREMSAKRNELLHEHAMYFGSLTIDTASEDSSASWEWVLQPWPWEGKGC